MVLLGYFIVLYEAYAAEAAGSAYSLFVSNAMQDDLYQGWYGPFIEEAAKAAGILILYYKWTQFGRVPTRGFLPILALAGGLTFGLIETFGVPKYAAVAGERLQSSVPFHGLLTLLVVAGLLIGRRLVRESRVGWAFVPATWVLASWIHGAWNRAFNQPDARRWIFVGLLIVDVAVVGMHLARRPSAESHTPEV